MVSTHWRHMSNALGYRLSYSNKKPNHKPNHKPSLSPSPNYRRSKFFMTLISIHKQDSPGGAITVPPNIRTLRAEADAQVGVKMHITPPIATEWLETRGNNRKVLQGTVDRYACDMKEGRWLFNGAPIQFDEEGKLLNGQHRLWAIIESGVAIEAVVQWGIPRDTQATIDAGAKWQSKDVLYMQGEKNTNLLSATLRWILRDEAGTIMSARSISNSQAIELLERHPQVRHSVEFIANNPRGPLKPSVAASENKALREDNEGYKHMFELRQKADQRAIERWRDGHPDRVMRLPDQADLCVWLMGQLDEAELLRQCNRQLNNELEAERDTLQAQLKEFTKW